MQKQRGSFTNSPIRRERPLYLILRRAILLPRAAEPSLPVCRLPSQAYAQWLTFVTQLSLFRCILALTVPFAVGFVPFPSELPPDQLSLVFTADSRTTSPDPIHFMLPYRQHIEYTPRCRCLSTVFRQNSPFSPLVFAVYRMPATNAAGSRCRCAAAHDSIS